MKSANSENQNAEVLSTIARELEATKKLLILLLAKLGSDSKEIGMALGVSDSTVRKMISISKVAPLDFGNSSQ